MKSNQQNEKGMRWSEDEIARVSVSSLVPISPLWPQARQVLPELLCIEGPSTLCLPQHFHRKRSLQTHPLTKKYNVWALRIFLTNAPNIYNFSNTQKVKLIKYLKVQEQIVLKHVDIFNQCFKHYFCLI